MGDVFPKLQTPKKVIRWTSEKSRFRRPFHKDMVNLPKHSCNLSNGTFTIFPDYWEYILLKKVSFSAM